MSLPAFSWNGPPRGRTRRATRRAPKAELSVESLEGRALLSAGPSIATMGHVVFASGIVAPARHSLGFAMTRHASAGMIRNVESLGRRTLAFRASGSHGNIIGVGFAIKRPSYYMDYTGPARPDENARAAFAFARRGNLILKGTMQGRINVHPASDDQEAYFVWGVNRGGATSPGPFPDEPKVVFDAVVVVSVESEGITATVRDLKTGQSTELPVGSAGVNGHTVRVAVPLSLLPSTGASLRNYAINLWPVNGEPPTPSTNFPSFIPENAMFRVAVR